MRPLPRMRVRDFLTIWVLALLLLATTGAPAGAMPLAADGSLLIYLPVERSFAGYTPGFCIFPDCDPYPMVSASFVSLVNGSAGAGHLTRLDVPTGVFAIPDYEADVGAVGGRLPLIEGLLVSGVANRAGAFSVGGAGPAARLVGEMPLLGEIRFCLFSDCNAAFVPANLSIPLAALGWDAASFASSFVNLTIRGAPWTTGTVNVGTFTQRGFAHGPASLTSSTAAPGGVISLVTPFFVSTSIPGGTAILPFAARLELLFVPEPASFLLLGAGAALLALLGRQRLRRHRRA